MDIEIINDLEQVERLLSHCCSCLFDEHPAIRTAADDIGTQQAALCTGNMHVSANIAANSALEKVRKVITALMEQREGAR